MLRWSSRALFLGLLLTLPLYFACAKSEPPEMNFELTGWASVGPGTTGGTGGERVTARTPEQLVEALRTPDPLIIEVVGTIDLGRMDPNHPEFKRNGRYHVKGDKTLIGRGSTAHITRGDLRIREVSNVIIRNIRFSEAPDTAIGISNGATHVWIDHNEFSDSSDGLLDITREADFITVSWNRFTNHNKVSLVGASDGNEADRGRLRVTFHHNWFDGTRQRHPRVRYGQAHLFNNYFSNIDAYAIGIGVEAQIVSEKNYFEGARRAWRHYDTPEQPGHLNDSGSVLRGISLEPEPLRDQESATWSPRTEYRYQLTPARDVPDLVKRGAGVGVIQSPAPSAARP